MIFIFGLSILIVLVGVMEYFRHIRRLNQIPIRIHINGTRGKSTLTRLIRAGLSAGGYRVVAKTTGTAPRVILENGKEIALGRRGVVSILEQIRVVAMAQKQKAEVLVIECMAITPEMQFVCEHRFIRSSIGVITNVRMDHGEQMGQDLTAIAKALSLTIPLNGTLVTSDHLYLDLFKQVGDSLQTKVVVAEPYSLTKEQQHFFPFPGADQSLGQALLVCEQLGVSRSKALSGMESAPPDPGAFGVFSMDCNSHTLYLANAFAANDSVSTLMAWDSCRESRFWQDQKDLFVVGIYVHRMDRGDRLISLAKETTNAIPFDHLVITGQALSLARRCFMDTGFPKEKISLFHGYLTTPSTFAKKLIPRILPKTQQDTIFFGFGNTKEAGNRIISYFSSHGKRLL
jgi:poly-gamma-glutamate synthase PgsB/CapB